MNNLTQEQVSELSDFELNGKLATLLSVNHESHFLLLPQFEVYQQGNVLVAATNGEFQNIFEDYCNNWNDLMPLVVEYKICLIRTNEYGDKWCADPNMDDFDSVRVVLKDAKRALAECLLQALIAKGE